MNNTKPFQNTSKIIQEQKRAIRWIALLVYITLDKQRKFKAIKNKLLLPDTKLRKNKIQPVLIRHFPGDFPEVMQAMTDI